jgi:hypothetical protein
MHSPPSVEYFKFSEATQLHGQFGKFDRPTADAKKLALAEVINAHNLRGYVAAANHKLLESKPSQLNKMMLSSPYDWAFMPLVVCVLADRCEKGRNCREN